MIGMGMQIRDVSEFNRRAACALRGVSFKPDSQQLGLAKACIASIDAGRELDAKQQQKLFNLIHRYQRQVTDRLVTEFAALKAKGHDA